jgi:hypothetical protein
MNGYLLTESTMIKLNFLFYKVNPARRKFKVKILNELNNGVFHILGGGDGGGSSRAAAAVK